MKVETDRTRGTKASVLVGLGYLGQGLGLSLPLPSGRSWEYDLTTRKLSFLICKVRRTIVLTFVGCCDSEQRLILSCASKQQTLNACWALLLFPWIRGSQSGVILSPVDARQYLEASVCQDWGVSLYQVGRDQGCCSTPYNTQNGPPQRMT